MEIEPVTVDANVDDLMANLEYLTGEELDVLSELGIELADLAGVVDNEGNPVPGKVTNRLLVAFGFLELRRRHPDLDWETGRRFVRLDLSAAWSPSAAAEVRTPSPTNAND